MRIIFPCLIVACIFWCISCSSDKTTSQETKTDSTAISTDTVKIADKILPPVTENELLITNNKFGKIDSTANLEQLENLFGEKNVTDVIEYGAEGMDSFTVTKIYKGSPKEIVIGWKHNKLHKEIGSAECLHENAPYYTSDSLKVGSTLQKLLEVNGKPIKFYGTGWDYGGTITSYNKGKLDGANIFFQLTDKPGMSEKLMGDQELNTDMPLVKSNLKKVAIASITLSFEKNTK